VLVVALVMISDTRGVSEWQLQQLPALTRSRFANRLALREAFSRELARPAAGIQPDDLAMADIRLFQTLNTMGPDAGDRALSMCRPFSARLPGELFPEWGEEFGVILLTIPKKHLAPVDVPAVERHRLKMKDGRATITISMTGHLEAPMTNIGPCAGHAGYMRQEQEETR